VLKATQGGSDDRSDLAVFCYRCYEFKGVNTDAPASETGQFVPLFNPRMQGWHNHFVWTNGVTHVIEVTPTDWAMVIALRLNNENVVEARSL